MIDEILAALRLARSKSGFSQSYIAEKLNIEQVTYGRWERGQTPITVKDLIRVCELLSIEILELFPQSQKRPAKSKVQVMLTLTEKNQIDIDLLSAIHQAIKNYTK